MAPTEQVRRRGQDGDARGRRTPERSLAEHGAEGRHQTFVPGTVQRCQQPPPGLHPLRFKDAPKLTERLAVGLRCGRPPLLQLADLDVQVPNLAQGRADPLELVPQPARSDRQRPGEELERRP